MLGIQKGIVKGITREVSRWDKQRKDDVARTALERLNTATTRATTRDKSVDVDLTQRRVDEDTSDSYNEDEDLEEEPWRTRPRSQVTTTDESD